MVAGGDVKPDAEFSSDSSHVLFRADRLTDDVTELFITPSAGGSLVQLNAPLVTSGNVIQAAFTPDGSQVVYLADSEVDEVFELYAVATSGGDVRKLSGPLVPGGDVLDWEFSPDGSQLVYRADQDVDQLFQLYSVELAVGSAPLSGDFNGDGTVDAADYTKWRDGFGSRYNLSDYNDWKTNFGRRSGSSASAPGSAGGNVAAVPEPASIVTLLLTMACTFCRRRQSSRSCSLSRAARYRS
jgi:WD40 repeat protein